MLLHSILQVKAPLQEYAIFLNRTDIYLIKKNIKLVIKSYVEIIYRVLKDFVGGIIDLLFINNCIWNLRGFFLPFPSLYC